MTLAAKRRRKHKRLVKQMDKVFLEPRHTRHIWGMGTKVMFEMWDDDDSIYAKAKNT